MNMLNKSLRRSSGSAYYRLAGGLGLLSLLALPTPSRAVPALLGDISINVSLDAPPPPPRREVIIGVSPGPDFVWIGGYWDGSPGHYVWVGGRWDHAPHGHGQWYAPHWDRDHDGHYRMTRGEWRDR